MVETGALLTRLDCSPFVFFIFLSLDEIWASLSGVLGQYSWQVACISLNRASVRGRPGLTCRRRKRPNHQWQRRRIQRYGWINKQLDIPEHIECAQHHQQITEQLRIQQLTKVYLAALSSGKLAALEGARHCISRLMILGRKSHETNIRKQKIKIKTLSSQGRL